MSVQKEDSQMMCVKQPVGIAVLITPVSFNSYTNIYYIKEKIFEDALGAFVYFGHLREGKISVWLAHVMLCWQ